MKIRAMFGRPAVRVAVLAACTAVLGSATMVAQDTTTPPPPPQQGPGGPGGPGRGGPEQQQRQLDMMTRQLSLTPDQVTKIKAIQDDGRAKMMALREDTSTPQADKRAKMMSMREEEQGKIKGVLTDDQKTKYDAMQARMRERQQQGGGQGAPPPPPPSL